MIQYIDKYNREITEIGKMRYRLSCLNASSAKYGNCEICKNHVSEVFLQTSSEEYKPGSYAERESFFGHKDCLINQRVKGE